MITIVYQHWQHGRLVESETGCLCPVMRVYTSPIDAYMYLRYGGIKCDALRIPWVRYEFVWMDDDGVAYYKMGRRSRA